MSELFAAEVLPELQPVVEPAVSEPLSRAKANLEATLVRFELIPGPETWKEQAARVETALRKV